MKNAIILTQGILNEVVQGIYGNGAVVTFLEEMEMDAVVVYNGTKIKRIVELEDALSAIGSAFNKEFMSYDVTELDGLGTAYVFQLPMTFDSGADMFENGSSCA